MKVVGAVLLILGLLISLAACDLNSATQIVSQVIPPVTSLTSTSAAETNASTPVPTEAESTTMSSLLPDEEYSNNYWERAINQTTYDINSADTYLFNAEDPDALFTNAPPQQIIYGLAYDEPVVRWYCARMLPSIVGAEVNGTVLTADLARAKLADMKNDEDKFVQDSAELGLSILNQDYESSLFITAPNRKKAVIELTYHVLWLAQEGKIYRIFTGDGQDIRDFSWSPNSVYFAFGHGIHHGNEILFYDTVFKKIFDSSNIYNAWDYLCKNIKELNDFDKSTADFYQLGAWTNDNTIKIIYSYVVANRDFSIESSLYYDIEKHEYSNIISCEKIMTDKNGMKPEQIF